MSETRKINLNSNITHVIVNDYGDTIVIDVGDANLFERFFDMVKKLSNTADENERNRLNIIGDLTKFDLNKLTEEQIINICRVDTKSSSEAINAIDELFGENTIYKVFRKSYENNTDFVPDAMCLNAFCVKFSQ